MARSWTQFEPPALSSALVSGANPYNPFGTDVLVDTLLTDLGPRTFTRRSEMLRSAGGLRGRHRGMGVGSVVAEESGRRGHGAQPESWIQCSLSAALSTSDPQDALNPFGGSGSNSPALLASLLAPPAQSRFRTEAIQSVASVRGPLASLPAGALELTAGAEWREERVRYDIRSAGKHLRLEPALHCCWVRRIAPAAVE